MRISHSFFKLLFISTLVVSIVSGCGGATNVKIGGTVKGLASGNKVELTNLSNGDVLSVAFSSSSTDFTFDLPLAPGDTYNVTVTHQPEGQICTVTHGIGIIPSSGGGDVKNIEVNCAVGTGSTVPITANVTGLADGAKVRLINNGVDRLTITGNPTTQAGGTLTQTFPTQLPGGSAYNIDVDMQPSNGQNCTVSPNSASGTINLPSTGSPTAPSPANVSCRF